MGVMGSWGPKKFEVNTNSIIPISGLTTAYKLKSDANSDTSGTKPTNTRGRELEDVSFSVKYLRAAGVDVRIEFGSWRELIGQSYPLIIGGVRFGPEKFELQSASITDTALDTNGKFLAATVALSFKEYTSSNKAATATAVGGNAGSAKGISPGTAKSMMDDLEAKKKEALRITAPADDKARRKTNTAARAGVKGAYKW